MYVIVVYDVRDQARMNRLRWFLRARMSWVQNSVFEGDMSEGQLRYLMAGIEDIISGEDSVIVYALPSDKYLKRQTLGKAKGDMGFVVRSFGFNIALAPVRPIAAWIRST